MSWTAGSEPASTGAPTSIRASTSNLVAGNNPSKLFTQCQGRIYLGDTTLSYPLPVDLAELNRQSLRTLLFTQIFGGPVVSPALAISPPRKVLEIGCGSGFWSMICYQYFKDRGCSEVEFVGLDIVPLASDDTQTGSASPMPGPKMKWAFVQHDIRNPPWPFPDNEFDLIVSRDMTYALCYTNHPHYMDENLRVLRPGGVIEIWETDHTIRLLHPHFPDESAITHMQAGERHKSMQETYDINITTPLSAPVNPFLTEYNGWLSKALDARHIAPNPCTAINHYLLQESDLLTGVNSRRVALPLGKMFWECEGVHVANPNTPDRRCLPHQSSGKEPADVWSSALRDTAMLTTVGEIQALGLLLREVNGKTQDEWDMWVEKMTTNLMKQGGTCTGECLEVGVWWAQKK